MKTEPSRPIPRKTAKNAELLIVSDTYYLEQNLHIRKYGISH